MIDWLIVAGADGALLLAYSVRIETMTALPLP
jgi:hypothetical protein